uniref:SSD domain-containing protein n=1 Tax=Chromera velia CCMP2878 TaxID=1169474 RepID=A0A0G4HGA5_9ALVE|eukprot:Cvel_6755.t1-p1 / transcript=Cvel_6755.t1 / gene=Cvel_6755 / organism=Chromera_velia_CCMP2878 / gene_product=hypothetical protein / transcript_product=hypothetical protein / location=Cvel_scaffold338:59726-68987(+) / protein_length=1248 / sequence_SO=supercontig / SO=protein_coding / is_pseudo=false
MSRLFPSYWTEKAFRACGRALGRLVLRRSCLLAVLSALIGLYMTFVCVVAYLGNPVSLNMGQLSMPLMPNRTLEVDSDIKLFVPQHGVYGQRFQRVEDDFGAEPAFTTVLYRLREGSGRKSLMEKDLLKSVWAHEMRLQSINGSNGQTWDEMCLHVATGASEQGNPCVVVGVFGPFLVNRGVYEPGDEPGGIFSNADFELNYNGSVTGVSLGQFAAAYLPDQTYRPSKVERVEGEEAELVPFTLSDSSHLLFLYRFNTTVPTHVRDRWEADMSAMVEETRKDQQQRRERGVRSEAQTLDEQLVTVSARRRALTDEETEGGKKTPPRDWSKGHPLDPIAASLPLHEDVEILHYNNWVVANETMEVVMRENWLLVATFALMVIFMGLSISKKFPSGSRLLLSLVVILVCSWATAAAFFVGLAFEVPLTPMAPLFVHMLVSLVVNYMIVTVRALHTETDGEVVGMRRSESREDASMRLESVVRGGREAREARLKFDPVAIPFERACEEAFASITLTAIGSCTALFTGALIDFPVVRYFCINGGTGIVALAFFHWTFFLPCLLWDERRMRAGRADVFPCVRASKEREVEAEESIHGEEEGVWEHEASLSAENQQELQDEGKKRTRAHVQKDPDEKNPVGPESYGEDLEGGGNLLLARAETKPSDTHQSPERRLTHTRGVREEGSFSSSSQREASSGSPREGGQGQRRQREGDRDRDGDPLSRSESEGTRGDRPLSVGLIKEKMEAAFFTVIDSAVAKWVFVVAAVFVLVLSIFAVPSLSTRFDMVAYLPDDSTLRSFIREVNGAWGGQTEPLYLVLPPSDEYPYEDPQARKVVKDFVSDAIATKEYVQGPLISWLHDFDDWHFGYPEAEEETHAPTFVAECSPEGRPKVPKDRAAFVNYVKAWTETENGLCAVNTLRTTDTAESRVAKGPWLRNVIPDFFDSFFIKFENGTETGPRIAASRLMLIGVDKPGDTAQNGDLLAVLENLEKDLHERMRAFKESRASKEKEEQGRRIRILSEDVIKEANEENQKSLSSPFFHSRWLADADRDRNIISILWNLLTLIALGVTIALCLFLHPVVGSLVGAQILMIDVIVLGVMAAVGVAVDVVALLVLAMAVGFSVEYVAHISHAFVNAEGSAKEKLHGSLRRMGVNVFLGAVSAFLGIVLLVFAHSDAFRTYFKLTSAVIFVSMLVGLLLSPVVAFGVWRVWESAAAGVFLLCSKKERGEGGSENQGRETRGWEGEGTGVDSTSPSS